MNGQRLIAAIVLVSVTTSSGVNVVAASRSSARGSASPTAPVVRAMRGPAPVLVERPLSSAPSAAKSDDKARVTQAATPQPDAAIRQRVNQALSNLPLRFVSHADPVTHFTARWADHTVFFAEEEIVFSVAERTADDASTWPWSDRRPPPAGRPRDTRSSVVRLRFPGANPHPTLEGASPLRGVVNYFLGNDPARWRSNVLTYAAVAYRDLYPGIDLIYRGTEGRLKSEFRVAPGADPGVIQMAYEGVEALRLRDDGALVLETPLGELVETAPLIYQKVDGVRRIVPGGYVLRGENQVGFQMRAYDPAWPLVIDPELTYSSYLGSSGNDFGFDIAVDDAGNIYVAGTTMVNGPSNDFPSYNAIQPTAGGIDEVFVTQIISAGGVYTYGYSTFLGGTDVDYGFAIAVDSAGNAYVTGATLSPDFPIHNAIQAVYGGGWIPPGGDAFVTKIISVSGVYTLAYSTYLGGSEDDVAWDIAVPADGVGYATVTGETHSDDFPTHNAIQPTLRGGLDSFVTQIISAGGVYTYAYSTYLGGSSGEQCFGIAVDRDGNAYITGNTESSDFPSHHAIQTTLEGGADAFVTQIISTSGVYTYGYSSYLGGDSWEYSFGIAVDDTGNIYVTGKTYSDDFPTHNAIQPTLKGGLDAFVTQIISAGGVYTYGYSTYLGGSDCDGDWTDLAIAVDGAGNAYVVGTTTSIDFPTRHAIQANQGGTDAFVTQIACVDGTCIYGYSTYLGGSGWDGGWGIAVDDVGNAYVTGSTTSSDFPTTPNAIQPSRKAYDDAFVTRLSPTGLALDKAVTPALVGPGHTVTYTLAYNNTGPLTATGVLITDVVPITLTSASFTSTGARITPTGSISYTWLVADLPPGAGGDIVITGVVSPTAGGRGVFTLTNWATITTTDAAYLDPAFDNTALAHNVVDAEPPATPTLLSPADGTIVSDTTTSTLTWQASPSPDLAGYSLDWGGTVVDVGYVTQYTVTVATDGTYTWTVAAYDALGNTSAYADTWSFTVDATAPAVVTTAPGGGAVDVGLAAPVIITFSKPIEASSFSYAVAPDPGGWSASWSNGGTVATLTHDPFAYWATYAVTITAAADLVGNPLAGAPYVWHFTTAPYRLYLPLALLE